MKIPNYIIASYIIKTIIIVTKVATYIATYTYSYTATNIFVILLQIAFSKQSAPKSFAYLFRFHWKMEFQM